MDETITHLGLLEDEAIDLDTSALSLALPDHPGTRLDPYLDLLTDMTRDLVQAGRTALNSVEQALALQAVLAGEYRFEGDRDLYDHPDNADLIRVIDRRRGLPVSLAILYVSAARRLGWQADVLNTPGHVLASIGPETDPVLIDPFDRGEIVTAETLNSLLERILDPGAQVSSEHIAPMSNRGVLIRLLLNQASRAERGGDQERALELYERMSAIAPDHTLPWWERARLEVMLGDFAAARSSLSAMLEITRDADLRSHICGALDSLSATGR
ncbi:SirB1 family protein [Altericroceibacterium xinjiangense]|uniref:SirB1 family protein n=1 Tax=Altericroceibacterium xinjiangense TaxID=762261 RepID=UPI000F7D96D2|nr:transglutaminase-like domain-containing protein [Altericroceibacterium xinjiangense]